MTRASAHDIVLQRAYDDPTPHDGCRVLVDRFWPRGRSKDVLNSTTGRAILHQARN